MSDQLSTEQVRERFLDEARGIVRYWSDPEVAKDGDCAARVSGAVFSMLVLLDGCHGDMPAFVVAPAPHPDDHAFAVADGDDYFPEAPEVEHDISGGLHELFYVPA